MALCARKRFRTHQAIYQVAGEFELEIWKGLTASLWLRPSHFTVGLFEITSFLLDLRGSVFLLLFSHLATGT
jgi:hypothetical protein